jgi:hypothetical protein
MSNAMTSTLSLLSIVARHAPRLGAAALLGAALALPVAPALADVCHPVLWVKETNFSAVKDLQRVWRATLDVDASRCASGSGLFTVRFVRAKENAVDQPFNERFSWRSGGTDVSLAFWADEAVQDYEIVQVAACPCKE